MASAWSWTSKGLTDSENSASSSCAPVFSDSSETPLRSLTSGPLLGDQVHAVEHRVDHQQVVVLVGGDRLLQVLAQTQLDRHPVGGAVAVVDHGHQRLDALQVLGVLGHVLARGDQVGDERDLLEELGVLLEEQVEGGEAAQHVLGQVGPVDPKDQVLAPAAQDLALVVVHLGPLGVALEALGGDRQGVGAHPHLAVVEVDDAQPPRRRRGRTARGSRGGSCAGRSGCGRRRCRWTGSPRRCPPACRRAAPARRRAGSTGCGRSGGGRGPAGPARMYFGARYRW